MIMLWKLIVDRPVTRQGVHGKVLVVRPFSSCPDQLQVDMGRNPLGVLSVQSSPQWHNIVTLDDLWRYLLNVHDLTWMSPRKIIPNRERQMYLTITWNRSGFDVVRDL
jgi:hypothetical protein